MRPDVKTFVRDQPVLRAVALRAASCLRALARAEPGIYTLCYHHVASAATARFAAQIAFLKRFGRFASADAALDLLRSSDGLTEITFVMTFDDGYADTLETALPVIEREAIPAILFLASDWLAAPPRDGNSYMDRDGVARWLAAGCHIGSHGATHRQFSRMSREEAAEELARSQRSLEALAGHPVRHFACPWGVAGRDFLPERDPALARAAGLETFFTTRRGHARTIADLSAMPRHVVEPEWPLYQLDALIGGPRFGRA